MKRMLNSITVISVLLGLALTVQTGTALAQRRRVERENRRRGEMVVPLPRERARIVVGGKEFFYSRGIFYHTGPRGYVAIRGPVGAHVAALPVGYVTIRLGAAPIFLYYGTYFQFDPVQKDYVVVNPPADAPAQPGLDRINLADGQTVSGPYMGGTNSIVQIDVNGQVREIPIDQIVSIDFAPPGQ